MHVPVCPVWEAQNSARSIRCSGGLFGDLENVPEEQLGCARNSKAGREGRGKKW